MAMVVANNIAAQLVLGEVRRNDTSLAKSLKKVSTGMRINGAADDASGYSITEKMRAQLRALEQDERNVQTGSSMLKVADGAVANIIEELRTIKELALNAANDTNTDMDRATIQKDVDNRLANINEIAIETNYNGKRLLDGTYGRGASSASSNSTSLIIKPENFVSSINFTQDGQTVTISEDGIYTRGTYDSSGGVVYDDNGEPVSIQYPRYILEIDAENVVLNDFGIYADFTIICKQPNTNLWITSSSFGKSITSYGVDSVIRFGSGSNNNLIVGGLVGLSRICTESDAIVDKALINIGGGLRIMGDDSGCSLSVTNSENFVGMSSALYDPSMSWIWQTQKNAPVIGLDMGERNSNADITFDISNVFISIRDDLDFYGYSSAPSIGSGKNGAIGDITVEGTDGVSLIGEPNHMHVSTSDDWAGQYMGPMGAGKNGTCGNVSYGYVYNETSPDTGIIRESTHKHDRYYGTPISAQESKITPLVIHHGTKANQALNVYLEDMRLDAMGLADIKVTTQHNATAALQVVDEAIEYALDQATHIGAYISRLEFTEENIVTATENTRASESTFCDADMAREMMGYTRANILLQASQSMLAQANSTSSQVLSLLQ